MGNDRKRKGLSKKTRFEVFKRDSFTCQYCGAKSPDVVLQCDHINPVAAGGEDDAMNLVTSCETCNNGKSDRQLDDSSVLAKQRAQLDELSERREQLEMMLEWRQELNALDGYAVSQAAEYWSSRTPGYHLNEGGIADLEQLIRKCGLAHVLQAMDDATGKYLERDKDGTITHESTNLAFSKCLTFAKLLKGDEKDPGLRERYYIRGILKNRLGYVHEWRSLQLIKQAQKVGIDSDEIKDLAIECKSWTNFRETLERWIEDEQDHEG